jgi:GNAT superfamily N-acetyltransferase
VTPVAVTIRALTGEPDEMRELQRVCENTAGYYERTTGVPPGPAEAQSTYTILPEGKGYADKFVLGIYADRQMVGCADLIRRYPDPATATLGLLLICESHQGRGIGRQALQLIEHFAQDWGSCERIRLGVVRSNAEAMPFWISQGYQPTGELREWRVGSVHSEVVMLEKRLPSIRRKEPPRPPFR